MHATLTRQNVLPFVTAIVNSSFELADEMFQTPVEEILDAIEQLGEEWSVTTRTGADVCDVAGEDAGELVITYAPRSELQVFAPTSVLLVWGGSYMVAPLS